MQPVSPNRWRALPTALLVVTAIALGAITARAGSGAPAPDHAPSHAVTPASAR